MRSATADTSRLLNSVPSKAMPVAMPTWRNVELMPEAMPARCGRTTPTAVEASGGLTRPTPTPATMNPGMRWVQSELAVEAAHEQQPDADEHQPGTDQRAHRAPGR